MNKIIQCIQCFNEENLIERQIKHLYDKVDEILIIEGACEGIKTATTDGHSTDKTIEIIENFNDRDNKITFIQRDGFWGSLEEIKDTFLNYIENGDWMLITDCDEFYNPEDINKIRTYIEKHKDAYELIPVFVHFFGDYNHIQEPLSTNCLHQRIIKKREGMTYKRHHPTYSIIIDGEVKLEDGFLNPHIQRNKFVMRDVNIYHFSWLKNRESLVQKLTFYYGYLPENKGRWNEEECLHNAEYDVDKGLYIDIENRILTYNGYIPEAMVDHEFSKLKWEHNFNFRNWETHSFYVQPVEKREMPTINHGNFYNYA